MTRRSGVRPEEAASRGMPRHARFLIAAASRAVRRLGRRRASQALHDFRVSLRRLRTWLNAFDEIGGVSATTRRRLKQLAHATNRGRDAEVQRDWLVAHRSRFTAADAAALAWLRALVKASAPDTRAGDPAARWAKLAGRLRRQLSPPGRGRADRACGPIVAQRVRREAKRLRQFLMRVRSVRDAGPAHRARIAVKRLRYLLEPFQAQSQILGATVAQLVALQDLLGAWQDRVVLVRTLADAAARASARHTQTWFLSKVSAGAAIGEEPGSPAALIGLLRMAQMADAEQRQLFTELRERQRSGGVAALLDQIRDCARLLAGASRPPSRRGVARKQR